MEYTYTITRTLKEEVLLDVLTTAIEGGIGYWACLLNDKDWVAARKQWKAEHYDIPCYCDTALQVMKNGKAVKFEDAEDEDEVWELTMEKFLNGIKMYEEKRGRNITKIIDDCDFDADDADCIIQYALFNEVVFG